MLTQLELEGRIASQDEALLSSEAVVMIQCVGCRNEDRNYCSRVCCSQAIKNALKLKEKNADMDVYILFRDMRTYGFKEDFYREASEKEVRFIRYEPDNKPRVQEVQEGGKSILRVEVNDPILNQTLGIDANYLVLSTAVVPPEDAAEVSQQFKVSLGPDGFFKEAHVKLRPVEFPTEGVFLCGTAHYPKHLHETINQAYGAASRVMALLSSDTVTASGSICEVDEKKCMGCGACITACAYGAIEFRETKQGKKAVVNPVICKGDGLCNSMCPTGAIRLKHFTDEELYSQIDAAIEKEQIGDAMDIAVGQ